MNYKLMDRILLNMPVYLLAYCSTWDIIQNTIEKCNFFFLQVLLGLVVL
jgi:hypothetical protein